MQGKSHSIKITILTLKVHLIVLQIVKITIIALNFV